MLPVRRGLAALVALLALGATGCFDGALRGDDDATTTTRSTTTTLVPRGLLSRLDQVLPGQCFDPLPDRAQRPYGVLAIPCEEPHRNEIFDRFPFRTAEGKAAGASVPYPGETAVRTMAEAGCFERFEAWMGVPWTESDYDIESFLPSVESWPKADRTITCTVVEFRGRPTTGSVRGTGK